MYVLYKVSIKHRYGSGWPSRIDEILHCDLISCQSTAHNAAWKIFFLRLNKCKPQFFTKAYTIYLKLTLYLMLERLELLLQCSRRVHLDCTNTQRILSKKSNELRSKLSSSSWSPSPSSWSPPSSGSSSSSWSAPASVDSPVLLGQVGDCQHRRRLPVKSFIS